jgi:hypothetical protein
MLFFAKSMGDSALFPSNIYIINSALNHSNSVSAFDYLSRVYNSAWWKIGAVKNFKERYGKRINVRMDFAREALQVDA